MRLIRAVVIFAIDAGLKRLTWYSGGVDPAKDEIVEIACVDLQRDNTITNSKQRWCSRASLFPQKPAPFIT